MNAIEYGGRDGDDDGGEGTGSDVDFSLWCRGEGAGIGVGVDGGAEGGREVEEGVDPQASACHGLLSMPHGKQSKLARGSNVLDKHLRRVHRVRSASSFSDPGADPA